MEDEDVKPVQIQQKQRKRKLQKKVVRLKASPKAYKKVWKFSLGISKTDSMPNIQ